MLCGLIELTDLRGVVYWDCLQTPVRLGFYWINRTQNTQKCLKSLQSLILWLMQFCLGRFPGKCLWQIAN